MPWLVLPAGAVCESVWATALGMSNGLTEPVATVVFGLALTASMVGLGRAGPPTDIPGAGVHRRMIGTR